MQHWNPDEPILDSISCRDIVHSTFHNQDKRDWDAVKRTVIEMMDAQIDDFSVKLCSNKNNILDELASMTGRL